MYSDVSETEIYDSIINTITSYWCNYYDIDKINSTIGVIGSDKTQDGIFITIGVVGYDNQSRPNILMRIHVDYQNNEPIISFRATPDTQVNYSECIEEYLEEINQAEIVGKHFFNSKTSHFEYNFKCLFEDLSYITPMVNNAIISASYIFKS